MVFSRFIGIVLLISAWPSAWAQDSDLSDAELEKQIAEMEKQIEGELLQEYSVWDFSTNLRLGGGYKENVTMSAFSDESSGFAATGFDLIGMRLPMDDSGVEATIFGAFDDRRYFDAPSVDAEQTGLINASLEKSLGESWILKTDIRLIYIDEMFDASLTEEKIGNVQVVGKQFSLEPALRWNLPGNTWLELKPEISRQYFVEPLDDYLEAGGRLSVGIDYGYRSELLVYSANVRRDYDNRSKHDEIGFYIPDTELSYDRPERGVEWTHFWDSNRRFRMRTRFSILENQDSGTGYFDYFRERLSHNWRVQVESFSLSATIRKATYDYDLQRSMDELNTRFRTDSSIELSLEYEHNENLTFQLGFEQESIQSNVPQDEYRYRVFTAGLYWEF
jgi:hypothetical protein